MCLYFLATERGYSDTRYTYVKKTRYENKYPVFLPIFLVMVDLVEHVKKLKIVFSKAALLTMNNKIFR